MGILGPKFVTFFFFSRPLRPFQAFQALKKAKQPTLANKEFCKSPVLFNKQGFRRFSQFLRLFYFLRHRRFIRAISQSLLARVTEPYSQGIPDENKRVFTDKFLKRHLWPCTNSQNHQRAEISPRWHQFVVDPIQPRRKYDLASVFRSQANLRHPRSDAGNSFIKVLKIVLRTLHGYE